MTKLNKKRNGIIIDYNVTISENKNR